MSYAGFLGSVFFFCARAPRSLSIQTHAFGGTQEELSCDAAPHSPRTEWSSVVHSTAWIRSSTSQVPPCNSQLKARKVLWVNTTRAEMFKAHVWEGPVSLTALGPHVWFPDLIPWPIRLSCLVDVILITTSLVRLRGAASRAPAP